MSLGITGLGVMATPSAAHATDAGSTFIPLSPARVLDTRLSGPAVGSNTFRTLNIAGTGGIPSDTSKVTSVVVNLTVVNPTQSSFLTVYAADAGRPPTANVDFATGATMANMVITSVSAATGAIDIYNHFGTVDVLVDVAGYYTPATTDHASTFNILPPTRILDTRSGLGEKGAPTPIGPGATLSLQVDLPSQSDSSAVVLNLASTRSTVGGDMTVYPDDGSPRPSTTDLNFTAGQTIDNLIIVPLLEPSTNINIYNGFGSTDALVDLVGYYSLGPGSTFSPLAPPVGLLDTRHAGPGGADAPLGAGVANQLTVQIAGAAGVPADSPSVTVTAVVLHMTVVNPSQGGFIVVYPDPDQPGGSPPNTSNINFAAGQLISNTVIVAVGADGDIDIENNAGTTDVVANISGYFTA